MSDNNKTTLVMGFTETKQVISFVYSLITAWKKADEDKEITVWDAQYLIPVILLFKDAFENIENVELELKMATVAEGEELKKWVSELVDLQDKTVEQFIEACFAVALDLAMIIRVFFPPSPIVKTNEVSDTTSEGSMA